LPSCSYLLTALSVLSTCQLEQNKRTDGEPAASAWNSLPSFVTLSSSLLTFKRHLKTYLYRGSKKKIIIIIIIRRRRRRRRRRTEN